MNRDRRSAQRAIHVQRREPDALALALAARDWERAALLVVLGMTLAIQATPQETIDELLDLFADEEWR